MRDDEIRKLLGGYATNTLTASERRALFEAALDDQELFDALQDEQALKQLLADPASRQAIQRTLAEPAREKPHWASRPRRWMWAGAAGVLAAVALIIGVVHQSKPEAKSGRVDIASTRAPADLERESAPEKKPAEEQPGLPLNSRRVAAPQLKSFARKKLTSRASDQNALSGAPAPQATASQQVIAEAQLKQPLGGSGGVMGGVIGGSLAAPKVNGILQASSEALRYTLLRKDAQGIYTLVPPSAELKPGDSVRLNVSPARSGYLSLDQLLPSGVWKRVFPESPPGRLVAANTDVTIPDSPIEVQNTAQKYRISLVPSEAGQQAKFALEAPPSAGLRDAKDAESRDALRQQVAPLTRDVSIGPGKVP